MKSFKNTLLQFTGFGMGNGNAGLSITLSVNYLSLLQNQKDLPKCIAFYNEGVKLLCEETPALEYLQKLQNDGVKLLACKTCLNFYGLADKMKTGIAATMPDIIELQKAADKVISL